MCVKVMWDVYRNHYLIYLMAWGLFIISYYTMPQKRQRQSQKRISETTKLPRNQMQVGLDHPLILRATPRLNVVQEKPQRHNATDGPDGPGGPDGPDNLHSAPIILKGLITVNNYAEIPDGSSDANILLHGSFEQARRIRPKTPDETTAKFRRHASGKDISRTLDANYERESETMGLGSQIWTVWAKKWWGNRSAETEKETEHVCPRIASRLCRTTRRTCGITKQNENSCITKKYHNKHLPPPSHNHSLGDTKYVYKTHKQNINTNTKSHTSKK